MRHTLLFASMAISLLACADDAPLAAGENDELAAVAENPWVDDLPSDPPAADPSTDDDDPWLDPPRTPRNPPAAPAPAPAARGYDFESDKQGWTKSAPPIVNVTRSTAQRASGRSALEVVFDGTGNALVSVANPPLRPGPARVSFRIFVPAGARLSWIQPFVQRGPAENYAWIGAWTRIGAFAPNTWTTITVDVPPDARTFSSLGVQFETAGSFRGSVFIDDVRF